MGLDTAGDRVYAPTSGTNASVVFSFPSGAPTTIDPTGGGTGVFFATALRSSTRPRPASPHLFDGIPVAHHARRVANGLTLLSRQRDGRILRSSRPDSNGTLLTDLQHRLDERAQHRGIGGGGLHPGFTADSNYVTAMITTSTDDVTGTLTACPVLLDAGGDAAAVQLGMNVVSEATATGSKVVFTDNYSSAASVADIHSADLGNSSPPVRVAESVYGFALSPDLTQIVYSTGVGTPGIYVVPVLANSGQDAYAKAYAKAR